jgi:hypothetical protein
MSRTLAASISTATEQPVTQPGYLIQIDAASTLRYCTRATLPYDGHSWLGGARVDRLDTAPGGDCAIALPNADNAMSALILADALTDKRARIWAIYSDSPTDAELMFDGVVDGADALGALECVVTLTDNGSARSSIPDVTIGPPLANHLVAPGTQITWGNITYTVEAAN